jgi:hypothetical protein
MNAQDILGELSRLSDEELESVAKALRELPTCQQAVSQSLDNAPMAGLQAGAWDIAADFDEPLPDNFWLGEEA